MTDVMRRVKQSLSTGYGIPIAVSVLLHITLGWFLLSYSGDSERKAFTAKTPQYIDAKLVKIKAQPVVKKKPKPKAKKIVKAPPKPKPKPKPKPAVKPKPKPKPDPKIAAAKRKALEDKKKALADKHRQEAESKRQQREQLKREQALQAELDREAAYEQAASDSALAASYISIIRDQVASNWSRPPSARNDMEVLLTISLVPTGDVASVQIAKSSGDNIFDQSAVRAVKKAARFAELQQLPPSVFEKYYRRFDLLFRPEDLRL